MFDVYHVGFANGTIGSDNYLVVYDHVGDDNQTKGDQSRKMEGKKL